MSSTASSLSQFERNITLWDRSASTSDSTEVVRSTLANQVILSLLGFANLITFGLLAQLNAFQSLQEEMVWMFGFVSIALGGIMLTKSAKGVLFTGISRLRSGELGWELLSTIGLSLVYFSSVFEVILYVPFGYSDSPMTSDVFLSFSLFFSSALFLALARLMACYFERRLLERSNENLAAKFGTVQVLGRTLKSAKEADHPVEKSFEEVKPGDFVRLSAGDYVPCDGVILRGACELEERKYTGQTLQRAKSESMEVFAGSRITKGEIVVKVANSYSDSVVTTFLDVLSARIEQSRSMDSKLRTATTLGCLAVLFCAACAGLYWVKSGLDSSEVLLIVCSILFVSVLLAPLSFFRHLKPLVLRALFQKGVILRDARVVDFLGSLKHFIVYLGGQPSSFAALPTSFALIDERVDEKTLLPVLFALLGGSDEKLDISLSDFLKERMAREKTDDAGPCFHVRELSVFPGQGVYGQIEGADITVGTESFLLDRGVHLEQSEIEPETESATWRYVALGPEIVAKIKFANQFETLGSRMVSALRSMGVRVSLIAESPQSEVVDRIGKSIGLELAAIHAGVSSKDLEEKFSSHRPVGLYSNVGLERNVEDKADISISSFDEIHWNIDRSSVTIFGLALSRIHEVVGLARKLSFVQFMSAGLCLTLAVLLLVLSAAALVNPLVTMLSALGALGACGILSQRVA